MGTCKFHRAVKTGAKLRLAVCGPSGCGKTYTLLKLAIELGGPVAFIDTEHGSASKYADLFEFDVLELDSFDPVHLIRLIKDAGSTGYRVLCIDSLSHFWMGKNGALDQVDRISKSAGNSFAAWRQVTPIHNALIEAIITSPLHVLASMRTKTEWIVERDDKTGKTVPRKVGLAPVMRDGIEYEFDICSEMDQDNTLIVTKTRCPALAGGVFAKPGVEFAAVLKQWLNATSDHPSARNQTADAFVGDAEVPAASPETNMATDTPAAAASAKYAEDGDSIPEGVLFMWKRMCKPRQIVAEFEKLRQQVSELGGTSGMAEYSHILREFGVHKPEQFKSSQPARLCARRVFDLVQSLRANSAPSAASLTTEPERSSQVAYAD